MRASVAILAVTLALLGSAGTGFAVLCATDPVPAATLLFPFVTARYDASSISTDPVTDSSAPTTLFAVTNVSSNSKIVHFVLWNDLSFPVLEWDVLLTGYDVITYSLSDILAGDLRPTGPTSSPQGATPIGLGPAPSFRLGVPIPLPAPASTSLAWDACTDTGQTFPYPVDTERQAWRIPAFNRHVLFQGMLYSQTAAMGGDVPAWVTDWRGSADGQVNGYITADIVAACGFEGPDSGQSYFDRFAVPKTKAFYSNDPVAGADHPMTLGNTLLGDWFVRDRANNFAQGGVAVHIEVDNMDVVNSAGYAPTIADGASFYRYSRAPAAEFPTTDALYVSNPVGGRDQPIIDRRESLPSSFAFRWFVGGDFDGGTSVRIWKETPDIRSDPASGAVGIDGERQYTYWAWDEEERVVSLPEPDPACVLDPASCPFETQLNQLPFSTQEVEVNALNFDLPLNAGGQGFGWMLLSFPGSNGYLIDDIPEGYLSPDPLTYGTQAWVEVKHDALGKYSVSVPAGVMGNYLCDGLPNAAGSQTGAGSDGRTDIGNWLY